MVTLTLSMEQRMYQIMKTSYEMKRDLSGKPEYKLEYQIANRIHLNAFCYLINKGLMPAECEENGRIALSLVVEGITHICAAKSVKGVMKADFEPVEKEIPGLKERMAQEEKLEREAQRSKKTAQHTATGTDEATLIRPQMVRTEGPAVDIGAVFREAKDVKQKTKVKEMPVTTIKKTYIPNGIVTAPASEKQEQSKVEEKESVRKDPEPDAKAETKDVQEEAKRPGEPCPTVRIDETATAREAETSKPEESISVAVKEPREEMPKDSNMESETEKSDVPDEGLNEENRQTEFGEEEEETEEQADTVRETTKAQWDGLDERENGQPVMEAPAEPQQDDVPSVESPSEQLESESAQEQGSGLMPESENESMPTEEPESEETLRPEPEVTPDPEMEEDLTKEPKPEMEEDSTQEPEPESESMPIAEPDETAEPKLNADTYGDQDTEEAGDAEAPETKAQEEEFASVPEEKKHQFTAREPEPAMEEPTLTPAKEPDMEAQQPVHNKKKGGIGGLFGRFMPKNSTQESVQEQDAPEAARQPATLYDIREESEFSDETPGITLCHTHLIKLKKTFGNAVSDPYVFYIWPTEVIEMYPERIPTSIFVYAKSPYGTIVQKVSDQKIKYIPITMDGKQFTIYGSWQNGRFETEVALINKTASVYSKVEVVRQNDPDIAEDAMLDPFRSAKENRKPEYFIVPLYGTNRGQDNVPIAAFARVNDKNYVIDSPGKEENSLLVSTANITSEITGRWEDGAFHYEIHQLDQL